MKKYIKTVFLVFILYSCKYHQEKPISTGKTSEVLIYVSDQIWNTYLADTIKCIFMQTQLGLNQPEPMFTILQMSTLSDLFNRHRNILEIVISDTIEKPKLGLMTNVYAQPQIYFRAFASSTDQMSLLLKKHQRTLVEKFRENNILRIQHAYAMHPNRQLQQKVKQKFGLSLILPESFYLAKEEKDFLWFRLETAKYSQGVLIYRTHNLGTEKTEELNYNWLVNWKNHITKQYIPAEVEGSYMRTDTTLQPYMNIVTFNNLNNLKAVELRGLWMAMHDFMGGPFVAIFFLDPKKQYVYAVDAYVYYPNRDKRDLLLQLEAILYSAKFD